MTNEDKGAIMDDIRHAAEEYVDLQLRTIYAHVTTEEREEMILNAERNFRGLRGELVSEGGC